MNRGIENTIFVLFGLYYSFKQHLLSTYCVYSVNKTDRILVLK